MSFYPKEKQEYYTYIDLALILSKQYHVKVSTSLEYITKEKKNPKSGIIEYEANRYIINDPIYIEKTLKDPWPPKFWTPTDGRDTAAAGAKPFLPKDPNKPSFSSGVSN